MQTPKKAISLICEFQGFVPVAKPCPAGVLTVGFGTTVGVEVGDTMTQSAARLHLEKDLVELTAKVRELCRPETTENELAAFISLAYNIGINGFTNSTVLRRHNAGDRQGAAEAFAMWNKVKGKVMAGLVRRRAAEAAVYMNYDACEPMPQKVDKESGEVVAQALKPEPAQRSLIGHMFGVMR